MFFTLLNAITLHFLIPALFLFFLYKRQFRSKFDWFLSFALVGVYVLFLSFTGKWQLFSIWFSYLLPILLLVISALSFWRTRGMRVFHPRTPGDLILTLFISGFVLLFSALSAWAYFGTRLNSSPIEVAFPLCCGNYYVIEGGNSPLLNQYHVFVDAPFKYSMDIVKLDGVGKRGRGYYSDDLDAYEIYGEKIYSPIAGVITAAVDTLPDYGPSLTDTSLATSWGNWLNVRRGEENITLAYIRKGSLQVGIGDTVAAGQFLAEVGSSGATPEPKLHMRAFVTDTSSAWGFSGKPIVVDGVFYSKNDRIEAPAPPPPVNR